MPTDPAITALYALAEKILDAVTALKAAVVAPAPPAEPAPAIDPSMARWVRPVDLFANLRDDGPFGSRAFGDAGPTVTGTAKALALALYGWTWAGTRALYGAKLLEAWDWVEKAQVDFAKAPPVGKWLNISGDLACLLVLTGYVHPDGAGLPTEPDPRTPEQWIAAQLGIAGDPSGG
jgi:hypothetical protein